MRGLFFISAVAAVAGLKSANQALDTYTFEQFEVEFNKSYDSPRERSVRRAAFLKNLEEIRSMNNKSRSATFGINALADHTHEDFSGLMGRMKRFSSRLSAPRFASIEVGVSDLPTHVDWRDAGILTPVKTQGACGSCWAFAATATIEAYHAKATGESTILSPQQLVDCVPNPKQCGGTGGCHGSTEPIAFDWVLKNGGMVADSSYPYFAEQKSCKVSDIASSATIDGWGMLPVNSYEAVLRHIAEVGPLAVSVAAAPFKFYKGGILDTCPYGDGENVDVNHAVQLIGYGTDEATGLDYWLIRNSWGPAWGEEGYVRLLRNKPDSKGFCGVDRTPLHGSACKEDAPVDVEVCGSCGVLSETGFVIINPTEIEEVIVERV